MVVFGHRVDPFHPREYVTFVEESSRDFEHLLIEARLKCQSKYQLWD
jgi:hypothetical protein